MFGSKSLKMQKSPNPSKKCKNCHVKEVLILDIKQTKGIYEGWCYDCMINAKKYLELLRENSDG